MLIVNNLFVSWGVDVDTIYVYNEEGYVFIIIIVIASWLILGVLLCQYFSVLGEGARILKAIFDKSFDRCYGDWNRADIFRTILYSFALCVVSCCVILGGIVLLRENELDHIDAEISECHSVTGEITGYVCEEQLFGDIENYECSFSVGEKAFEIYITYEQKDALEYLQSGKRFTVYYQTKGEKNLVAQIDMLADG